MFQVITHFSTLCAPSFHSSQLIDESINRTFFGKDVDYCLTLLISFLFWVFLLLVKQNKRFEDVNLASGKFGSAIEVLEL